MRNWTQKLYNTEIELRLWEYMPFTDLSEASGAIRAIQSTDLWHSLVPNAPVPVVILSAKTWNEGGGVDREGLKKVRGKEEYSITYPMGCKSFGFTLHEAPHMVGKWREGHDDEYMRAYVKLWKLHIPHVYCRIVFDKLREKGIPVEEFLQ